MPDLPSPELLEDICARFVLALPATELESFERLLFSVEQAWWHYEDHVRQKPQYTHLTSLSLKDFTGLIFDKCPGLQPFRAKLEEIYKAFNDYKHAVPVRGAILVEPSFTKCLLVRGYRRDAGWGFPRGKLAMGETDAECAIREVLEETGYDISSMLKEDQYVDVQLGDQATRLFFVPNVAESTLFAPRVRGEIGAFGWHVIGHLPGTWEESRRLFINEQGGRHRFFNVWPYIRPLQKWIGQQQQGLKPEVCMKLDIGQAMKSFTFDSVEVLQHLSTAAVG